MQGDLTVTAPERWHQYYQQTEDLAERVATQRVISDVVQGHDSINRRCWDDPTWIRDLAATTGDIAHRSVDGPPIRKALAEALLQQIATATAWLHVVDEALAVDQQAGGPQ